MSVVGMFPGFRELNRRTIKAPVNPLDVSTVVSIFPVEIDENKCTLQPGRFIIAPGNLEKPAVLPIGPSSWWREIDPDQPLLEIPVASILIADAIVKDYCVGMMECNMGDKMPGLFYVPGTFTSEEIKKKYMPLLMKAHNYQRNWYSSLVNIADSLWARSGGNPSTINGLMRLAASELGYEDKEWAKDSQTISMVRCFACGTLKNPQFPICPSCRSIDQSHPEAKNIKFAS